MIYPSFSAWKLNSDEDSANLTKRGRERGILLYAPPEHFILVVLAINPDIVPHDAVSGHLTLSARQQRGEVIGSEFCGDEAVWSTCAAEEYLG